MLCFAVAVMGGILVARFHPGLHSLPVVGWPVFALLSVLFCLGRDRDLPPPAGMPAAYIPLIVPRPGFVARRGLNRAVLLLCAAFFLIGFMRQVHWAESRDPARLPERRWFQATLQVAAPSSEHDRESGRWRVGARLLTADGDDAGGLPVRLSGPRGREFRRGDVVVARVRLSDVHPPAYPGAFDFRFWLERDGLVATLDVVQPRADKKGEPYRVVPVDSVPLAVGFRRFLDGVRFEAISLTLGHGDGEGGMLAAMIYGYRKDMPGELRDAFRRAGIGHVLAISGLHVGLIVGLLWWLGGLTGWNVRVRAVACLGLSLVYLGLSGGQVAAARATVMAVIHLAGIAWGRKSDMLNSLGAAAFLIALFNPTAPLDVGFQLSFTAVVFIHIAMYRAPGRDARPGAESRRMAGTRIAGRLRREVVSLARLSVATWLGLYPIIALVFNQVNLVGLPINVLVIPLMSFVLAGGLLLPWLGWIPGAGRLLTLPTRILNRLAVWSDGLPGSSFAAHGPSVGWTSAFYAFVLLYMLRAMLPAGKLRRRWELATGLGMAVGLAGITASMSSLPPPAGGRIAVLPARGMGAIVAEAPNGDLAIVGGLRRGGLDEAGWLHSLRRGGRVSVVALGGATRDALGALDYHNRIDTFLSVPLTAGREAMKDAVWTPIPGMAAIEYALSRDWKGRVVWVAVRAGDRSAALASRIPPKALDALLAGKAAGHDAELLCVEYAGAPPHPPPAVMPKGMVAVRGGRRDGLPGRWFGRRGLGALVTDGEVKAYDGEKWLGEKELQRFKSL